MILYERHRRVVLPFGIRFHAYLQVYLIRLAEHAPNPLVGVSAILIKETFLLEGHGPSSLGSESRARHLRQSTSPTAAYAYVMATPQGKEIDDIVNLAAYVLEDASHIGQGEH